MTTITSETYEKFVEAERRKEECIKTYVVPSKGFRSEKALDGKKFLKLLEEIGITLEQMQEIAQNREYYEHISRENLPF